MKKNLAISKKKQLLFRTNNVQYLFAAKNAPHRAIIVSNLSGNYELHAADFQTGFHRQITHTKHGTLFGSISADGKYVYVLQDASGAEHGHFVRIPFEGGEKVVITPNLKQYFSYSVSTSDDNKTMCFTATTNKKNNVFVVKGNYRAYHARNIFNTSDSLSEPVCAPDGSMVCIAKKDANTGKSRLVFLSTDIDTRITYSPHYNSVIPLAFSYLHKKTLLALVRKNHWYRPMIYNMADGYNEIHHLLFRGDVWVLSWNETDREMILCDVYHAEQKLYRYNTLTKNLRRIGPRTGSFSFHFGSVGLQQDGAFVTRWSEFNTPPILIAIRNSQNASWYKIPKWSAATSSQYNVKSIYIKSSDGEKIQMWVVRPRDTKKPIPFVIDIHGGPHGVALNEFSPEAQAWLQSGFGYCAVNYRGSIGFGKKFERKIYGNPGYFEAEDIVAARQWLVRNKYANPQRITLHGWSWGGYVVLRALGTYPTLWNAGIAGAAIGDFVAQYEDEPTYFQAQDREIFKGTPKTASKNYIRSSPMTYVKKIQSPILILHGKYDVRCPPRQMKNFISALKKNKKIFNVEWFVSGHTGEFTDTNLRVSLMEKAIQFALNAQKK